MKTTCIEHPAYKRLLIIREWQYVACEGRHCAAALLSYFEYWHNVRLEQREKSAQANALAKQHGDAGVQDISLWQFHTLEELAAGIIWLYKRSTIIQDIDQLVHLGFIKKRLGNPDTRYKRDTTNYYQFLPENVNQWLADYKAGTVEKSRGVVQNGTGVVQNRTDSVQNQTEVVQNRTDVAELSYCSPESSEEKNSLDYTRDYSVVSNTAVIISKVPPAAGGVAPSTPAGARQPAPSGLQLLPENLNGKQTVQSASTESIQRTKSGTDSPEAIQLAEEKQQARELVQEFAAWHKCVFGFKTQCSQTQEEAALDLLQELEMPVREIVAIAIYAWLAKSTKKENGYITCFHCRKFSRNLVTFKKHAHKILGELGYSSNPEDIEAAYQMARECEA